MQTPKPSHPVDSALKYSGVGFQIVGTAVLGFFLGLKADEWFHTEKPYFTALLAIIFTFAGLYLGLRQFFEKGK